MLKNLKPLLLPNQGTAVVLTSAFTIIICFGTLTPIPVMVEIPGTDYWHHSLAFAALTYPLIVASRRNWPVTLVFGLSFGALIEIIQPYVNRFGDTADFKADVVGIVCGFLFGVIGYFLKLKITVKTKNS